MPTFTCRLVWRTHTQICLKQIFFRNLIVCGYFCYKKIKKCHIDCIRSIKEEFFSYLENIKKYFICMWIHFIIFVVLSLPEKELSFSFLLFDTESVYDLGMTFYYYCEHMSRIYVFIHEFACMDLEKNSWRHFIKQIGGNSLYFSILSLTLWISVLIFRFVFLLLHFFPELLSFLSDCDSPLNEIICDICY